MRKLEFLPPNFICKVKDRDGHIYEKWLFRFETEDELKAYLAERTYTLVSAEKYDFQTWLDKADTAGKAAADDRNKPGFEYNNALWTELKQYLFAISHGKCGYCEQKVTGVYAGDVEHYRPKKKVTEDPNHSGYYWLAYDASNYVPVCQNCNGARAKANHFPLEPGSPRAYGPADDVTQERPLLINPLGKDDPAGQFEFVGPEGGVDDFGIIKGTSVAGEKSREIYHLNRGDLITARRQAYKTLTDHKYLLDAQWQSVTEKLVSQWKMGMPEFTLVLRAVLTEWFKERKEKEQQALARAQALLQHIDNELLMLKR